MDDSDTGYLKHATEEEQRKFAQDLALHQIRNGMLTPEQRSFEAEQLMGVQARQPVPENPSSPEEQMLLNLKAQQARQKFDSMGAQPHQVDMSGAMDIINQKKTKNFEQIKQLLGNRK